MQWILRIYINRLRPELSIRRASFSGEGSSDMGGVLVWTLGRGSTTNNEGKGGDARGRTPNHLDSCLHGIEF